MKLSELIVALNIVQEKLGDVEVCIQSLEGESHEIEVTQENFKGRIPAEWLDANGDCWCAVLVPLPID